MNGGVQFRSVRVKQPANEMSGFQADIGAGYSGCLYDESRRNTFLVRAADDQIKRLEKPGDWNRYEVRCAGPRIQIVLNGEKTVDYTESRHRDPAGRPDRAPDPRRLQSGDFLPQPHHRRDCIQR